VRPSVLRSASRQTCTLRIETGSMSGWHRHRLHQLCTQGVAGRTRCSQLVTSQGASLSLWTVSSSPVDLLSSRDARRPRIAYAASPVRSKQKPSSSLFRHDTPYCGRVWVRIVPRLRKRSWTSSRLDRYSPSCTSPPWHSSWSCGASTATDGAHWSRSCREACWTLLRSWRIKP
jgi:hypothetical protein